MRETSTIRPVSKWLWGSLIAALAAASPSAHAQADRGGRSEASEPSVAGSAAADSSDRDSEAEKIAGLRKLLATEQQRLEDLRDQLSTVEEEFQRESDVFTQLDQRLTEARAAVEAAADGTERNKRREAVAALEEEWEQARKRFDRVIARRRAFQGEQAIVEEKVTLLQESLARREEVTAPAEAAAGRAPQEDAAPANAPDAQAAPSSGTNPLGIPGLSLLVPAEDPPADPQTTVVVDEELAAVDERVLAARQAVEARRVELEAAQRELEELDRKIALLERDIENAQQQLEVARQEADAAAADVRRHTEAAEDPAAASDDEIEAVNAALAEDRARLQRAGAEIAEQTTRVSETEALLAQTREARGEAAERVDAAADELTTAQNRLAFLESPFSPHRIRRWFTDSAPKVLGVVLLMAAVWWLIRNVGNRFITALVWRSRQGTEADREQRAETLRRVFLYVAGLSVLIIGILAVLNASGIDVSVLLGGAAVLGAAIAFGSQNLIKDYFSGFMILAENQYSVGNVVRIADTTGVVEDISLRMTVLRDEEGTVHFIPHGQITKVSNLTHGWSRAVLRIAVGYNEDADRVMEVLMDIAREMRDDEVFGPKMLGDPEMQGVDAFDESAVVVKILLKTRPLMQWAVKREMLRRVKKKFDQLGIEIPFPQRVIHHVSAEDEPSRKRSADRDRHHNKQLSSPDTEHEMRQT